MRGGAGAATVSESQKIDFELLEKQPIEQRKAAIESIAKQIKRDWAGNPIGISQDDIKKLERLYTTKTEADIDKKAETDKASGNFISGVSDSINAEREREKQNAENVSKIDGLLNADKDTSNGEQKEIIGKAGSREIEVLKAATGIDATGYNHTIDKDNINHALNRHGNEGTEKQQGQLAITKDDIKLIPSIIANADKVEYSGKNRKGLDAIKYTKAVNGTIYFIEEVRTGRKEFAFDTMYKRKRGERKSAYFTDPLTPEALSPANPDGNIQSNPADVNNPQANTPQAQSQTAAMSAQQEIQDQQQSQRKTPARPFTSKTADKILNKIGNNQQSGSIIQDNYELIQTKVKKYAKAGIDESDLNLIASSAVLDAYKRGKGNSQTYKNKAIENRVRSYLGYDTKTQSLSQAAGIDKEGNEQALGDTLADRQSIDPVKNSIETERNKRSSASKTRQYNRF